MGKINTWWNLVQMSARRFFEFIEILCISKNNVC